MTAIVGLIDKIEPHPNADKLELVTIKGLARQLGKDTVVLVTGKHYRVGQMGVYFTPGSVLPGYLAEDLWLVGSGGSKNQWVSLGTKNMRGVESPGMFAGAVFQNDRESAWQNWPHWRDWAIGDDVSAYYGVAQDDTFMDNGGH